MICDSYFPKVVVFGVEKLSIFFIVSVLFAIASHWFLVRINIYQNCQKRLQGSTSMVFHIYGFFGYRDPKFYQHLRRGHVNFNYVSVFRLNIVH